MRLKEDDGSWRASGIKRRMYRQAPLTPEEEVPRHKSVHRKKKKHEHDWKRVVIGRQVVRRTYRRFDGSYERTEYEMDKTQLVCTRCGNKRGHNYWAGY